MSGDTLHIDGDRLHSCCAGSGSVRPSAGSHTEGGTFNRWQRQRCILVLRCMGWRRRHRIWTAPHLPWAGTQRFGTPQAVLLELLRPRELVQGDRPRGEWRQVTTVSRVVFIHLYLLRQPGPECRLLCQPIYLHRRRIFVVPIGEGERCGLPGAQVRAKMLVGRASRCR